MRAIYRGAMRYGSPILFWLSLLIVLASFLNVYETIRGASATGIGFEGFNTLLRFQILLSSVSRSLLLGALPFGAAVIIHRIDRYLKKPAGPSS